MFRSSYLVGVFGWNVAVSYGVLRVKLLVPSIKEMPLTVLKIIGLLLLISPPISRTVVSAPIVFREANWTTIGPVYCLESKSTTEVLGTTILGVVIPLYLRIIKEFFSQITG